MTQQSRENHRRRWLWVVLALLLPLLAAFGPTVPYIWVAERHQQATIIFDTTGPEHGLEVYALAAPQSDSHPTIESGSCHSPNPAAARGEGAAGETGQRSYRCTFVTRPGRGFRLESGGLLGDDIFDWARVINVWGLQTPDTVQLGHLHFGFLHADRWFFKLWAALLGIGLALATGWRPGSGQFSLLWKSKWGPLLLLLPMMSQGWLLALLPSPSMLSSGMPEREGRQETVVADSPVTPPTGSTGSPHDLDALERSVGGLEIDFTRIRQPHSEAGQLLVLAPVSEELFYRAGILGALLKAVPATPAILVSSVIFACAHEGDASRLFSIFVSGLFLGLAWLRTRSLAFCVLAHSIANLASALKLFRDMEG